jgi:hypothetical protein
MYRISRIRLAGVGPADARFDKPSPDTPSFEISCIGAGGAPEDSVIWLENGGGKTVFLSLLFHVLRPDKAPLIGGDEQSQRTGGRRAEISDFVLPTDVSHAVCEWVAADGDDRLITGMVAERKGAGVNRTWYLLNVREGAASLDDLVFDVDGRRVPLARYVESLEQLASKAGKAGRRNRIEMTKTSVQRQWFGVLADHDLDPTLFEYQVRMNRSEGGATSLFRFPSPERFVEFFLELTLNPETVTAISAELSRVAEKVASLPRKELELAHATGAGDRLDTLAGSWARFEAADQARTTAQHDAERLHDQLAVSVALAAEAADEAANRLAELDTERTTIDRVRREADTRAKTVAIRLAGRRVTLLNDEVTAADKEAQDRQLTVSAWPRVSDQLRRTALDSRIAEVRRAVQAAEQDAEPLRERRDALLRSVRRAIDTAATAAESDVKEAEGKIATAEDDEKTHDEALRKAERRTSEIAGLLRGLDQQIERHQKVIDKASADGTLPSGVELATALDDARSEVRTLGETIDRIKTERDELAATLPDLRQTARDTESEANTAAAILQQHRQRVAAATSDRERLAADPLLAELGAEGSDLDLVGADLVVRLSDEASRRRAEAIAAGSAAAEDQRAADSLERDHLLPARAEVDEICRRLHAAGVASATPGWRYLVDAVPAASHAAAIASHPALVDGVVVASADLDPARDALADIAPSAAILIAAGALLTDPADAAAQGWVVPPAAALHDRGASEEELSRRQERLAEASARAATIADAERSARSLADAIAAHLEEWPAGTLPAAVALAHELAHRAESTRTAGVEASAAVTAAEALVAETDRTIEQHRIGHTQTQLRAGRLERLAADAADVADATAQAADLRAETETLRHTVDDASKQLHLAKAAREAAQATKATAERTFDGLRQQAAGLPDPGAGEHVDDAGTDIVSLRASYEAAAGVYSDATSGSDIAHDLATLEQQRQSLASEWIALSAEMRQRVEQLAATPAASSPVSRTAAEKEANEAAARASTLHGDLRTKLGVAEALRKGLPDPEPTWAVEPFDMPEELDALEQMSAEMDAAFEVARVAAAEIRERLGAASTARDERRAAHGALNLQTTTLAHNLGDRAPQPASAYEGDAGEAVTNALRRISGATQKREEADGRWRTAAHAVGVFAREGRWAGLTGELARRLRDDEPLDLARASKTLLTQTRILEQRLRDDIATLDTHRQVLVTSLGDAVSEAARSLRSARRKSELPSGLGDWSHQPFLKIGIELAKDRAELDGRLRRFTNDLLERASSGASLPVGADLICQATLACTDKAVTIDVLKPNKAQRLRYVPITETATLSGGMRATAAIAMFCTLAKVRAANRTGRIGVGTLILDNPFGDANATYLVALQRLVAQMSDVQLVYTTGVNDMDALRLFPVVTRLTNEAAKRSHLAYVVADEAFLKRLAPAEGDNAIVTGTRLVRRQQPLLAVDLAAMDGDEDDH